MHWTQKYLAELGHIRRRMRALQGSLPPPLHSNLKTPSQQGNAEQWAQSCLWTALSSLCLEATWSWQSWADAESKSTTHLAVQDWQLRGGVLYGPWPHWINTSQSPPPPQKSQPWDCPIITLVPITKKKKKKIITQEIAYEIQQNLICKWTSQAAQILYCTIMGFVL